MSTEHDRLRKLLGAYVLGGLDAADRALLEGHLDTCPTCREELAAYAGVPSLLKLGDGPISGSAAQLDDGGLSRALGVVRQGRRRRQRRTVLVAAAAAVLVLGLGATTAGLVATQRDAPHTPTVPTATQTSPTALLRLVATADSPARGETSLTAKPWGTSLDLDLSALPEGQRFIVWVIATDGTREQAATWASTPDGVAHVTGASALTTTDVAAVRVSTAEGTLLLSAHI